LRVAHDRWTSGVYAIWYPIKDRPPVERFHRALVATGIRKILLLELCPYPDDASLRLNGSGMIVINPPWMLEETLQTLLPQLLKLLQSQSTGRSRLAWLVPE
jgi:23S rRNA (adenine2030-N6)-methyltransferase